MDRYQMNRQAMTRQSCQQPYCNSRMTVPYAVFPADSSCCIAKECPVDDMPIAMGYVPMQKYQTTFELCKALRAGTIFPELYKPFTGKRGRSC